MRGSWAATLASFGDYTWPEAVTHLATHAARRFRLTDRGLIRPGFAADLAVLDPATVTDRSTYAAGRTLAEGVAHVVVNGTLVLENGEPTKATPGRVAAARVGKTLRCYRGYGHRRFSGNLSNFQHRAARTDRPLPPDSVREQRPGSDCRNHDGGPRRRCVRRCSGNGIRSLLGIIRPETRKSVKGFCPDLVGERKTGELSPGARCMARHVCWPRRKQRGARLEIGSAATLRPDCSERVLAMTTETCLVTGDFDEMRKVPDRVPRRICPGPGLGGSGRESGSDHRDGERQPPWRRLPQPGGRPLRPCGLAMPAPEKRDRLIAEYRASAQDKPDPPADAEAHRRRGQGLYSQGKFDEAIAEYKEALRINPRYAPAHNGLGTALNRQEKLDEAVAAYKEAIRIQPGYAQAHYNLGLSLGAQGNLDEAIPAYKEAIRINPKYEIAHCDLGNALHNQGKLDEAIAEYKEAIRINPKYDRAYYCMGNSLSAQGRVDEAIDSFKESIRLNPRFSWVHVNLGKLLDDLGSVDESIAEYKEAIRLQPGIPAGYHNLGIALHEKGKLDESIAAYKEAIRNYPDFADAHNGLGIALCDQRKLDESIAEYHEAIRINPGFAFAHNNLSVALRLHGRLNEAVAEAKLAIRIQPGFPAAYLNLGQALRDQGKRDESVAAYKQAIRFYPGYAQAYNGMAWTLALSPKRPRSEYDEALRYAREAIELAPQ